MTEEVPDSVEAPYSRPGRLARHAGFHLVIWLASFSAFAAADSWNALSGLGIAALLSVVTGIIAGLATSNIIHEWFHLFGAWWSGGSYDIPDKLGLFIYDWTFAENNTDQFTTMSIAGTVGSVVAIVLLWNTVPTDTAGRVALLAAAIGSLAFAGAIEWPVLQRTRMSGEPLAELSRIDQVVLLRSLSIGIAVAVISALLM